MIKIAFNYKLNKKISKMLGTLLCLIADAQRIKWFFQFIFWDFLYWRVLNDVGELVRTCTHLNDIFIARKYFSSFSLFSGSVIFRDGNFNAIHNRNLKLKFQITREKTQKSSKFDCHVLFCLAPNGIGNLLPHDNLQFRVCKVESRVRRGDLSEKKYSLKT